MRRYLVLALLFSHNILAAEISMKCHEDSNIYLEKGMFKVHSDVDSKRIESPQLEDADAINKLIAHRPSCWRSR